MSAQRICLNMIVKNEAPVIQRCLASVKPWIDHWVIVDTGSSDGTQECVQAAMAGVPGNLHERPWKDFAFNRNEALDLARNRANYVLFIDADEELSMPEGFQWPTLEADGYMFDCSLNGWTYSRNSMISTKLGWRWEGVLHEFLTSPQPHRWHRLAGPQILVSRDGARARDPSTYLKDIEVLKLALQRDPNNARYTFYLAQSYRDANLLEDSIRHYKQRIALGGWEEERWFSAFQVGVLSERIGAPTLEVQQAYLTAYAMRPTRAEPLCELARFLRLAGDFPLAHLYALRAAAMEQPDDMLFVDGSVYAWRALDELATSAWYVGAHDDGRKSIVKLLSENRFPDAERQRLESNRSFYG